MNIPTALSLVAVIISLICLIIYTIGYAQDHGKLAALSKFFKELFSDDRLFSVA
jgi:hypothetical protein